MMPSKIEEERSQSLVCTEKEFIRDFIAEGMKKDHKQTQQYSPLWQSALNINAHLYLQSAQIGEPWLASCKKKRH